MGGFENLEKDRVVKYRSISAIILFFSVLNLSASQKPREVLGKYRIYIKNISKYPVRISVGPAYPSSISLEPDQSMDFPATAVGIVTATTYGAWKQYAGRAAQLDVYKLVQKQPNTNWLVTINWQFDPGLRGKIGKTGQWDIQATPYEILEKGCFELPYASRITDLEKFLVFKCPAVDRKTVLKAAEIWSMFPRAVSKIVEHKDIYPYNILDLDIGGVTEPDLERLETWKEYLSNHLAQKFDRLFSDPVVSSVVNRLLGRAVMALKSKSSFVYGPCDIIADIVHAEELKLQLQIAKKVTELKKAEKEYREMKERSQQKMKFENLLNRARKKDAVGAFLSELVDFSVFDIPPEKATYQQFLLQYNLKLAPITYFLKGADSETLGRWAYQFGILKELLKQDGSDITLFSVGSRGYLLQEVPQFIVKIAEQFPEKTITIYSVGGEKNVSSLADNPNFVRIARSDGIEQYKHKNLPITVFSFSTLIPINYKYIKVPDSFYTIFYNLIERKLQQQRIIFIGNNTTHYNMADLPLVAAAYYFNKNKGVNGQNLQLYCLAGTGDVTSDFIVFDPIKDSQVYFDLSPIKQRIPIWEDKNANVIFVIKGKKSPFTPFDSYSFNSNPPSISDEERKRRMIEYNIEKINNGLIVRSISGLVREPVGKYYEDLKEEHKLDLLRIQ